LTLLLTRSWDYGICRFEIDGKPVGEAVDLYSATIMPMEKVFRVGNLSAGQHVLRVVNQGKNAESKGFYFGLDGWTVKSGK
jgi:hypothetical protein